eukprot:m.137334 g.137334  ORF g.137334 m.137334 type:complete len:327 (+) comp11557_c0_seq1:57-1037(+)
MGCGSSKSVNIDAPLPDIRMEKETKKRKRNKEKKHGHLFNVLDESKDCAEAFWSYAAGRSREWSDWKEWLLDGEDNESEEELRKPSTQLINLYTALVAVDQERISEMKSGLEQVETLLQSFLDHDALLRDQLTIEKELDDAQKRKLLEEAKHNKAKRDDEAYSVHKERFEQMDRDMAELVKKKIQATVDMKKKVEENYIRIQAEKRHCVKTYFHTHASKLAEYHRVSLEKIKDAFPSVSEEDEDTEDDESDDEDDNQSGMKGHEAVKKLHAAEESKVQKAVTKEERQQMNEGPDFFYDTPAETVHDGSNSEPINEDDISNFHSNNY